MLVTMRGRRWILRTHVANLKHRGECDAPSVKGKEVRIKSTLRGEERLEVLIHELTHAAGWDLSEEFVEQFAHDLARILYRKLGYREPSEWPQS